MRSAELDFILVDSKAKGGVFYLRRPTPEQDVWTAYDLLPGGRLANPRVAFHQQREAGWRGLPDVG
jgi:hypothetical protein